MKKKKRYSIKKALFTFTIFLYSVSLFSLNSYNECDDLIEKIQLNFFEYQLDKKISQQTNEIHKDYLSLSFAGGIFFQRDFNESYSKTEYRSFLRNKNNNIVLEALSPNLFDEYSEFYEWIDDSPLYDFKAKDLTNAEIIAIDNQFVADLSDDDIKKLIYLKTIGSEAVRFEVKDIKGVYREFVLDFQKFPQTRVSVPIEIRDIYDIDSLGSSFKSRYTEIYTWQQNGMNNIGNSIIKNLNSLNSISEKSIKGFSCTYETNEISNLGLYIPNIKLSNLISEDILSDEITFSFNSEVSNDMLYNSSYWTRTSEKIAEIKSKFDYQSFPFDMQELSFRFEPQESTNVIPYLYYDSPLEWSLNRINLDNWKAKSYHIENYIFQGAYGFDMVGLKIGFNIERYSLYYLLKIYLPLFIVLLVSLSVMFIKPSELESRLTVSVICFLALITYTYIVDNDIPKLSYLTIMDYVILLSYFFSALPTLQSIYIYKIFDKSEDQAIKINKQFIFWVPIIYFIGLILMVFTIVAASPNTIAALRFTT